MATSGKRHGQVPLNAVTDPVPSSPVSKSIGSASVGSAVVKRRERKKKLEVQGEGAPEVRQSSTNKEQNAPQHSGGSLTKKRPSQGSPEFPSPTNNDSVSPPEQLNEQQEPIGANISTLKKVSEGSEDSYKQGTHEQNHSIDSTHADDHVTN